MRHISAKAILILSVTTLPLTALSYAATADHPTSRSWTPYVQLGSTFDFWRITRLPEKDPIEVVPWMGGKWRFRREGGKYIVERPDYRYTPSTTRSTPLWIPELALQPSTEIPGDLDLVANYAWDLETTKLPQDQWQMKAYPHPRPIVSYLHPMTDPRVLQYFYTTKELWNHGTVPDGPTTVTAALRDLAAGMVADAPDDLFRRFFLMDALAASGDTEALAKEIDLWHTRYKDKVAHFGVLRLALTRYERTRPALELSLSGRNGFDLVNSMSRAASAMDLPTRCRRFPEILQYEDYAMPWLSGIPYPDYLRVQINAKVFHLATMMYLLQGDRARALETATALYHLGQLMSQHDTMINRLIGIAIRGIASKSLALVALDACETPDEEEAVWKKLEWLNQREKTLTPHDLVADEPYTSYFSEMELINDKIRGPNIPEAMTRSEVADAHFQLVRMAAAAWHQRLVTKEFPSRDSQFDLLGGSIPSDPFGPTALRFTETSSSLVCYSIGPNRKDDHAAITYDPTNGTFSPGDITLEVPQERKYPFPNEAVKATNKEGLLAQFPNGLPPDPFADTRNQPLGITNTSPVIVYSYGPDTNEAMAKRQGEDYYPAEMYDPTNGISSAGDLTLPIPTP